jgi:hypothetical protein
MIRKEPLFCCIMVICAVLASLAQPGCASDLPPDDWVAGWRRDGSPLSFTRQDLYGYIDGGAELFFEFGFSDLLVQRYRCGNREVSLELYQMTGPDAGLAVYWAKRGRETLVPGIQEPHTGGEYQITVLKGRYFVQANNQSGEAENLPVMIKLLQWLLPRLPAESAQDWLQKLPVNRVAGSELLVAGPYSLQMVYTLGEGDVLQLAGGLFGVCADVAEGLKHKRTLVRVEYPTEEAACAAMANVQNNLDEYLVKVRASRDSLTFKDFNNEYGRVVRSGSNLELNLHLLRL